MLLATRTRTLGIAAALALAAAVLTLLAVSRGDGGGARAAAPAQTRAVLVAARDLPVGTSVAAALAEGDAKVERLPVAAVQPNALETADGLRRHVVVQPIYAGEQLTASRLGPTAAQGLRTNLQGALRALAVPGDANQLLAGTLQAGDHVDIVASVETDDGAKTRVALRDLVVLAAPAAEDRTQATAATLRLTDDQVQRLFWILKNGEWSFVLRPSADAKTTVDRPATRADVLAGR